MIQKYVELFMYDKYLLKIVDILKYFELIFLIDLVFYN